MKESRFFYVPGAAHVTELPEEETTHALRVLRLKSGDEIFLMDGEGSFHRAEVTMASSRHCMYAIKETLPQEKSWRGRLHVAVAPTKDAGRTEWFAEKATEIGIDEISFLDCRFSERRTLRTQRVERIVVSAAKQSRKPWLPVTNEIVSFNDFMNQPREGGKFICHCHDDTEREDLFKVVNVPTSNPDITVLIGPEGDFSAEEVRLAKSKGYVPVSLGTSRLRTETAALYAVMVAQLARRIL